MSLNKIQTWDGLEYLSVWPSDNRGVSICNMINGTDASSFQPFQTAASNLKLYTFSTDICRLIYFEIITQYSNINILSILSRNFFKNIEKIYKDK